MVGEARFKKNIWKGLIAIFAITIFFVFQITALKFDYDFEKFFPANDAENRLLFILSKAIYFGQ